MTREEILNLLKAHLATIRSRFEVECLRLFGSAARDELQVDSDIDVLVAFSSPATFERFMGLKFYLEELPGRSVDLVTEKALRTEFRASIERESLRVL